MISSKSSLRVVLPGRADPHLFVAGVDAAGRQVQGTGAHGPGDLADREAQRAQPSPRNLDRDLVVANPRRFDVGDHGKGGERVLGAVGDFLEGALRDVAVDHEPDHALPVGDLGDLGAFRARREGLDPVDARLDVVQRAVHVLSEVEFRHDPTRALGGRGANVLDPLDSLDPLLDLEDDRLLDLVRRGARIRDRNPDPVQRDLREHLLHQTAQGEDPR